MVVLSAGTTSVCLYRLIPNARVVWIELAFALAFITSRLELVCPADALFTSINKRLLSNPARELTWGHRGKRRRIHRVGKNPIGSCSAGRSRPVAVQRRDVDRGGLAGEPAHFRPQRIR